MIHYPQRCNQNGKPASPRQIKQRTLRQIFGNLSRVRQNLEQCIRELQFLNIDTKKFHSIHSQMRIELDRKIDYVRRELEYMRLETQENKIRRMEQK